MYSTIYNISFYHDNILKVYSWWSCCIGVFCLSFNSRLTAPMVHYLRDRMLTAGLKIRSTENILFSHSSLFDEDFLKSRVFDSFLCHKFFPGHFVTHFSKIVSLLSSLLGFLQCFQPGLSNNWLLFFGQLFFWRIFRLSDRARVSGMKRRRLRITQHLSVCKDWTINAEWCC